MCPAGCRRRGLTPARSTPAPGARDGAQGLGAVRERGKEPAPNETREKTMKIKITQVRGKDGRTLCLRTCETFTLAFLDSEGDVVQSTPKELAEALDLGELARIERDGDANESEKAAEALRYAMAVSSGSL